jgi:Transcriptional regulator PadR-like family
VSIQDHIKERTGREPSTGSVYASLDQLEEKAFVKSRQDAPIKERGGKRKLFFHSHRTRPTNVEAAAPSDRCVELRPSLESVYGMKKRSRGDEKKVFSLSTFLSTEHLRFRTGRSCNYKRCSSGLRCERLTQGEITARYWAASYLWVRRSGEPLPWNWMLARVMVAA